MLHALMVLSLYYGNDILEEIKSFYQLLYKNKDNLIDDVNLNTVIQNTDIKKVSENWRKQLD